MGSSMAKGSPLAARARSTFSLVSADVYCGARWSEVERGGARWSEVRLWDVLWDVARRDASQQRCLTAGSHSGVSKRLGPL
jgi:hypothetical protein